MGILLYVDLSGTHQNNRRTLDNLPAAASQSVIGVQRSSRVYFADNRITHSSVEDTIIIWARSLTEPCLSSMINNVIRVMIRSKANPQIYNDCTCRLAGRTSLQPLVRVVLCSGG